MSVYDVLKERGFLKQLSHEDEIKELLEKEKITFYIGFDPTADSQIDNISAHSKFFKLFKKRHINNSHS